MVIFEARMGMTLHHLSLPTLDQDLSYFGKGLKSSGELTAWNVLFSGLNLQVVTVIV
jgi:hypothetical protein